MSLNGYLLRSASGCVRRRDGGASRAVTEDDGDTRAQEEGDDEAEDPPNEFEEEEQRVFTEKMMMKNPNIHLEKLADIKNPFFEKKREVRAEVEREKRSKLAGGRKKV